MNNNGWNISKQVIKDNLGKSNTVDPRLGLPGMGKYGQPELHFEYGRDHASKVCFACDPDLIVQFDKATQQKRVLCLGVTILCPRCMMPLYIRTPDSPRTGRITHDVEIHWSDRRVGNDGYWRPAFTVSGHFGCDYLTSEATGVSGPRAAIRCGWRGGILRGRCFDHL